MPQIVHLQQADVPAQVIWYDSGSVKIPTGGRIVKIYCGKDEEGNRIEKEYIPLYMGFDIETTNIVTEDHKAAYMYIAQCCIATHKGAYIYMFRRWDQVCNFFFQLSSYLMLGEKRRVICYIANMSFEHGFMRKRLKWMNGKYDFFAKETRKPLLVTYSGIEFREALTISGGGLAELAESFCKTRKLKGDLDYSIPRNSKTLLTDQELQYCYNDVIILAEFSEFIYSQYIRPTKKIPLTKTGLLRAEVKAAFKQADVTGQLRQMIQHAFPTQVQYNFWWNYLFRGGYVHANILYSGRKIDKLMRNYDITSSYPAQMNIRGYPMSKFEAVEFTTMPEFENLCRQKCVIFCVTFKNIRATTSHCIESYNKVMSIKDYILDNGRVRKAASMTVALTEIDWQIYKKYYTWEGQPYIYDIYTAKRGYLPSYLLDVLNSHYINKATMKRDGWHKDPDKVRFYSIEKSGLNAGYGLLVTKIQLVKVVYDNELGWQEKKGLIDYDKEVKNQCLLPQWGIYCTAWARFQLLDTMWKIYERCGNITAYCDTDSLKNVYHPLLQSVIDEVNAGIKAMLIKRGLTDPLFSDLGQFSAEEDYIESKFLGAKRYLARYPDGSIHATIAGLPKDAILHLPAGTDPFDYFSIDGMYIDAEISDKLGCKYIDEETSDIVDGEVMTEKTSVCLFAMAFKLKIDKVYHSLVIESIKEGAYII